MEKISFERGQNLIKQYFYRGGDGIKNTACRKTLIRKKDIMHIPALYTSKKHEQCIFIIYDSVAEKKLNFNSYQHQLN